MKPLAQPKQWCIRSFEANPKLLPKLQQKEHEHRAKGLDVRFIDGMLSTTSGSDVPRTIVTYSKDPWGSGVSRFDFRLVHSGKPPVLASEVVRGASFDIRHILRRMLHLQPSVKVALRLDVRAS